MENKAVNEAVGQVPGYVVDALEALKDKVDNCTCSHHAGQNPYINAYQHGLLTDPSFLGTFMLMLFEYNDQAYQYLITEDGQEVDFEKLQYAIIAFDLKQKRELKGNK